MNPAPPPCGLTSRLFCNSNEEPGLIEGELRCLAVMLALAAGSAQGKYVRSCKMATALHVASRIGPAERCASVAVCRCPSCLARGIQRALGRRLSRRRIDQLSRLSSRAGERFLTPTELTQMNLVPLIVFLYNPLLRHKRIAQTCLGEVPLAKGAFPLCSYS